ncbi:hypothetical protein HID58_029133 [Brassica napus]|uniref:Uncharacterized protein n=1 Tax=Brassica napus TaxID=3708 RepID=A0ABQ8CC84_BRANA|nr:hypothetical protein HID58_029133 [Brassica napus]
MDLYRAPDANTRSCFSLEEISNLSKKKRPFSGQSFSRRFDAFNFHKIKYFSKDMSQISSSHFPWSPNSEPFSPLPSFRALFQRFPQQASHQCKPSVSESTLVLQRFGHSSEESTGASEESVGAAAEPTKPAVLGGYMLRLFPSSAGCSVPGLCFLSLSKALSQSLMHSAY